MSEFNLVVAVTLLLLVMLVLYFVVFVLQPESTRRARARLFSLFDNARSRQDLFDLHYVRITVDSIEREFGIELSTVDVLEDYLVHIQDQCTDAGTDNNMEGLHTQVYELISLENEEQPFERLPEDEGRLFRSLSDAIRNADSEAIKFNLDELCSVVTVRHREYQRSHKVNRWAVPLAGVGLFLTLVFGVTNIVGTVNKSDLEKVVTSIMAKEAEELKTKAVEKPNGATSEEGNEVETRW